MPRLFFTLTSQVYKVSVISLLYFSPVSATGVSTSNDNTILADIVELNLPVLPGAREPDLAVTSDGKLFISWLEPTVGDEFAFRISRLTDAGWSAPGTIAKGNDWFVNWADFPTLSAAGGTRLAASWHVINGPGAYAYDLVVSLSTDYGKTWSKPIVPHKDGTPTQHGLASMFAWQGDQLFMTWLDGRVNAQGVDTAKQLNTTDQLKFEPIAPSQPLPTEDMSLRWTLVDEKGQALTDSLLDDRVCTCCGTAAVMTDKGPLVAYRDRSDDEVRDIAVQYQRDGKWSGPVALHRDGWQISGCPINGPALAANGMRVAATWFTAANDHPKVFMAYSDDGGEHFGEPVVVDDGRPLGRVDVVLLDDGSAFVSWLEITRLGEELRVRHILPDGKRGSMGALTSSNRGRTMGFPRMLRHEGTIVFVWNQPAGAPSIRTAILTLPID